MPTGFMVNRTQLPAEAYLKSAYVEFVQRAGGLPVLAPPVEPLEEDWPAQYQGEALLLVGGDDLDPARFGQPRHPQARPLHPRREQAEFAWFDWAQQAGVPILGICLGCQVINVARGGSLHQFLGDRPGVGRHRDAEPGPDHDAEVTGPLLASILGKSVTQVATNHKQAVDALGRGLIVSARAPDGVIEAIEDDAGRFILGVQWHPEEQLDHPATLALGRALIEAARR
jgi:gamma-glutamyl-gamma-aminobutyrate hydrolase PuuD